MHRGASVTGQREVFFFAQTNQDRTLNGDEGFVGVDQLRQARIKPKGLVVKPYPREPEGEVIFWLMAEGASIAYEPTYALLADAGVTALTLSSSVGCEARFFGSNAMILHPKVQNWSNKGPDLHVYSRSTVLWHELLELAGFSTVSAECDTFEFEPNQIRAGIRGPGT